MATYVPAKRATEYITYIGLSSQSTPSTLQSNPTIAAGDFKVSKDGGALANLSTLPAVTPASSKMVKITLSSAEMTADNVTVICSDAAGAEWCDLLFTIQTSDNQIDDLPTNAELTTALGTADDATLAQIALVKTETDKIASIKTKTDSLTFTVANQVDANVQAVNDVALVGDGSATPWGPA